MPSTYSNFTGTEGGQFRAYVDMTRTYVGTAVQNYENWTVTGYVDRTATGITGYSRPDAWYDLESGTYAPGEGASGYVSINWANTVGRKFTTAISNMTIERFPDGAAYASTASFYFFAGFGGVGDATATVGWTTNAVPRAALVTASSGNVYETDSPSITFSNPASMTTDVYLELVDLTGTTQYALRTNVTSPYTWTLTTPEKDAIRLAMTNTNSTSLGYFVKTNYPSGSPTYNGTFSTITIDNRSGIADPTFSNFTFTDTTSAVAATSGGFPVMVQGKSIIQPKVIVANKAVAIKQATMSNYLVSLSSYSQSMAYSSGSDVSQNITLSTSLPTFSGSAQPLTVRAIDSRTNGTTVTKSVEVLPYEPPYFPPTLKVGYANQFDTSGGLAVTLPGGTNLVNFSPLYFSGTDYNVPVQTAGATHGVRYQLHKDTIVGGNPWNDVAFTQTAGTGVLTVTAATLASDILSTMNGMGADNDVTWYVIFKIVDKYNTVTYMATIDVGAPIFRIGVDGFVYNNEKKILTVGDYTPDGWHSLAYTPNTVTNQGRKLYSAVFNSVDLTDTLSAGMRLRIPRAVTAPTQSASLNGTNQYFSKTSPAAMSFTDDFATGARVKLAAFPGSGNGAQIIGRMNGTQGWILFIDEYGRVVLSGYNAAVTNYSRVTSSQSIPLNRWVHIAAQLDMSAFTASTTTSYVMMNGEDVPVLVSRSGTYPTALVQAGNLEVGGNSSIANFYVNGKMAQAAVFNTKVTQATMQGYMNQGFSGAESGLISAYSLSNSVTDLNTTNANNLTANNSAVTTNADSPFAEGSGTNEYGIIVESTFSTNTTVLIQTGGGGVIPTSGGFGTWSYSSQAKPFKFPDGLNDNRILAKNYVAPGAGTGGTTSYTGVCSTRVYIPAGRRIRIKAFARYGNYSTSQNSTAVISAVMDGTTTIGYGTSWLNGSTAASNSTQPSLDEEFTPTAGYHTFTLSFSLGGGFQMSGYDAELQVELVS